MKLLMMKKIYHFKGETKMDFDFSGSYYLSENDEKEILNAIADGMSVEEAVRDWVSGLDDLYYFIINEFILDRIISYIESEVLKNG